MKTAEVMNFSTFGLVSWLVAAFLMGFMLSPLVVLVFIRQEDRALAWRLMLRRVAKTPRVRLKSEAGPPASPEQR